MDETTKVIIGTLSGFIIAFFAEPVKNYFSMKTKLHNLRVALYKELLSNYYILTHFVMDSDASDAYTIHNLAKYELRTEFYNHTLQHESSLFYQLKEANVLNISYVRLNQIMNLNTDLPVSTSQI